MISSSVVISLEKIQSIVSSQVGTNHKVYGVVDSIEGIVGTRKVSISIYHEKFCKTEEESDTAEKEIHSIAIAIRKDLFDSGYSVSEVEDFCIGYQGDGDLVSPLIRFRCSINILTQKTNSTNEPVEIENDKTIVWA